jgi:hypothetical protein
MDFYQNDKPAFSFVIKKKNGNIIEKWRSPDMS